MSQCRYCDKEAMRGHVLCYRHWMYGHQAQEVKEIASLKAALEELPFSADVNDTDYPQESDYQAK